MMREKRWKRKKKRKIDDDERQTGKERKTKTR
jgi:hypothetical protein